MSPVSTFAISGYRCSGYRYSGMLAGLVVLISGCAKQENAYVPPPPPEVTVANPVAMPIYQFLQEEGETEPAEEAEVRARVKGFIEGIQFEPGRRVEAGQVLYLIEPDTYQAALDSAQAALAAADAAIAVAEATLKNAEAEAVRTKADLDREQRLLEGNAGSQADYDRAFAANEAAKAAIESAKASIKQATAQEQAAKADVQQAELDFNYTKVVAPIAGRITKTTVKKGNLVENGTALATIVDDARVFANFSLSDRQVLELQREYLENSAANQEREDLKNVRVLMRREIDQGFPFSGTLDYVDQTGVDANTATVGLRAVFDNPEDQLFGGLFVTVRIPSETAYDALLVPESAVSRDQLGSFVLTISSENKVEQTRVTVKSRVSGWAAIEGSVETSSLVVIDGVQRAVPGSEVEPDTKTLEIDAESLLRGMTIPVDETDNAAGSTPEEPDAESSESETSESETSETGTAESGTSETDSDGSNPS